MFYFNSCYTVVVVVRAVSISNVSCMLLIVGAMHFFFTFWEEFPFIGIRGIHFSPPRRSLYQRFHSVVDFLDVQLDSIPSMSTTVVRDAHSATRAIHQFRNLI